MAFFFCKKPQMWPKGPAQIVVWIAEGIRGYEVVGKRNIQMKFYVTEEEKRLIDEKMSQLLYLLYGENTGNFR